MAISFSGDNASQGLMCAESWQRLLKEDLFLSFSHRKVYIGT